MASSCSVPSITGNELHFPSSFNSAVFTIKKSLLKHACALGGFQRKNEEGRGRGHRVLTSHDRSVSLASCVTIANPLPFLLLMAVYLLVGSGIARFSSFYS